ncbi:MAG: Histidinol-phosphate aminotransferase [Anaerolineales bacterium]|nr:Histidinol-phosphate aminotransferase [Anaerolineales bacterium]
METLAHLHRTLDPLPAPAHHGAIDFAELERLGLDPDEVLDFSVNSNPYGPSPAVREALARVPLDRYPDREALALRRALADRLGITPEQIVAGNGTAELLWLIGLAFLRSGDRVLVLGPTFGEYRRVAALAGAKVEVWTAQAEQAFTVDVDGVARRLQQVQPRVAFLCNPNNPTGTVLPPDVIEARAEAHPQTLFVVDEAYLNFVPDLDAALTIGQDNLLVLRSMTKDYALAGLRLGYASGYARVIEALASVRPPWNVNAMAQAAGVAALSDEVHLQRSLSRLVEDKAALVTGLSELGLASLPSAVHFFLIDVGDGAAFRRKLLRHGILVRDCASFGLPAYVRIAARRPEENQRLLAAIREVRTMKTWSD